MYHSAKNCNLALYRLKELLIKDNAAVNIKTYCSGLKQFYFKKAKRSAGKKIYELTTHNKEDFKVNNELAAQICSYMPNHSTVAVAAL